MDEEEIGQALQHTHADVLIPYAESTVDFYGEQIVVALVHADNAGDAGTDTALGVTGVGGERRGAESDGGTMAVVAIRTFTDYLGLDWSAQRQRIERDEVLAEAVRRAQMTGADGKQRQMLALPLDLLPGFLFGVQPARVREELRDKLMRYRRSCFQVLWRHMQEELLRRQALALATPQSLEIAEQLNALSAVERLLHEHLANLLSLPAQVEDLSALVTQTAAQTAALIRALGERQAVYETRVEQIDARTQHLTPAHERLVQQLVTQLVRDTKRCAEPLTYLTVYGAIKRRFQVASFKEVADGRYEELIAFLHDLFVRATNGAVPTQDKLF